MTKDCVSIKLKNLFNIKRDANANNLRICKELLKNKPNDFAISFTDDGSGFDRSKIFYYYYFVMSNFRLLN